MKKRRWMKFSLGIRRNTYSHRSGYLWVYLTTSLSARRAVWLGMTTTRGFCNGSKAISWWRWWMNRLGEMLVWAHYSNTGKNWLQMRRLEAALSAGTTRLCHLRCWGKSARLAAFCCSAELQPWTSEEQGFVCWEGGIQTHCTNWVRKQEFQKKATTKGCKIHPSTCRQWKCWDYQLRTYKYFHCFH